VHTNICLSLNFSQKIFIETLKTCMLIVFLLIVTLSYSSFLQHNRMISFIFFIEFLKDCT
jgi:hypothetical protein